MVLGDVVAYRSGDRRPSGFTVADAAAQNFETSSNRRERGASTNRRVRLSDWGRLAESRRQ